MEMAFTAFDRAVRNAGPTPEVKARWGILRPGGKTRRDSNPARRQPGAAQERRKS